MYRMNHKSLCCRKGGPLPGPKRGYLTLRNELSEKTLVLTKQMTVLGKGTHLENRIKESRRTALPGGWKPWVL